MTQHYLNKVRKRKSSVEMVNVHDLNDLLFISQSNWAHRCKIYFTASFLGGALGFLAGVKSLTDLASHLCYFPVTAALNGLFNKMLGVWIYFVQFPGTTTPSTLHAFPLSLTESEIWQRKLFSLAAFVQMQNGQQQNQSTLLSIACSSNH